jgi:hypothetical protein
MTNKQFKKIFELQMAEHIRSVMSNINRLDIENADITMINYLVRSTILNMADRIR